MIRIEIDDAQVKSALSRLSAKVADPKPALRDIGEFLVETTKQRFATSTDPKGNPWTPNSRVTILAHLKSNPKAGSKKPLIATGGLGRSFRYQIEGNDLLVGSNWNPFGKMENGAAIHQFGGPAGKDKSVNIPARPFLGISDVDREAIERTVLSYLTE